MLDTIKNDVDGVKLEIVPIFNDWRCTSNIVDMSVASITIIGRYLTLSLETCTLFCTTTLNPVLLLMLAFSMPCRRTKIHRRVIFKAFVLICVEVTSTCVLNGSHQGYPEVKMGIPCPIITWTFWCFDFAMVGIPSGGV